MPRIRKKTSKRGTTNQREKIKRKVSETRRKRKKEAKKNPQWKSKQKKDPGIPNNFPYKDQILAEVAEQRRQAEEAKQLRKELKKKAKAASKAGEEDASDDEGSEVAFDGIGAIPSTKLASSSSKVGAVPAVEEAEDEEAPVLMNHEFPNLKSVLEAADVIIEVLDARDPLAYHIEHLQEFSKTHGKKMLLVLSKIDACPREAVSGWVEHFRTQHPTVLFRSASAFLPTSEPSPAKGKGKERADDALGASTVIAALKKFAAEKTSDEPLVVAVVGITNSGKSSLINSLSRKSSLPIYKLSGHQDGPTTTMLPQEVSLEIGGKNIRLIDTPGVSWKAAEQQSAEDAARTRSRDILIRNKGRIDRLKDPEPAVHEIVMRANTQDLMVFYNLPAFAEKDANAFLSALARAQGLIKKGGVLDVTGASRHLLRDWSTGKFPHFTLPSASSASMSVDSPFSDLYTSDEKVLASLPTRKERRKAVGVVKLAPSEPETRKLALETPWIGDDEESDEDAEGDVEELDEGDEDASGEEDLGSEDEEDEDIEMDDEEDDDEEEEEEEVLLPPPGKRKRSAPSSAPARPSKKVAFAEEPKNTRAARSAAGAKGTASAAAKKTSQPAAKAPTKAKAIPAKPAPPVKSAMKVANAKKSAGPAQTAKPGEDAYDFKKFF